MLKKEADLTVVGENGMSHLHYAILYSNKEAAQFLLNEGANIHVTDRDGKKALHHAAKSGCNGAHVNAPDKDGKTALHYAASGKSYIEDVKLLIDNRANVNAADKEGNTPLKIDVVWKKQ